MTTMELILLGLVASLLLIYLYKSNSPTDNLPPGPKGLPLVGSIFHIIRKRPQDLFFNWCKEFGDIYYVKLGTTKLVVLGGAKTVRDFYSQNHDYSGRLKMGLVTDIYDNPSKAHGIIGSEGPEWEELRRFTLRQLRDFGFGKQSMESYISDEVLELIQWIKLQNGAPISNLRDRITLAMVNALWTIVTGQRLRQDDPHLIRITRGMQKAMTSTTGRGSSIFFAPWIRYVIPELSGYNGLRRAYSKWRAYFERTVKSHKKTYDEEFSRDFIDVFLKEIKARAGNPNSAFHGVEGERHLIGTLSDLFLAGTDTTSTTLAWSILYLSKYAEVQDKLYLEISSITNNNSRPCSISDRARMPYAEAVLHEILRYSSIVPMGVPHRSLRRREYKGYTIPKDTAIMANLSYIHFNPESWGDPQNFRPERFLQQGDETGVHSFKPKNEFLMPFSVGKRQCLGELLARDTLFIFLTNIFQKFHVRVIGDINLDPVIGFVMSPHPFKCVFTERY